MLRFINDRSVSIKSIEFYGQYQFSKSKEWMVAWVGGIFHQGVWSAGRILLIDMASQSIQFCIAKDRPTKAQVSDNGDICFIDYGEPDSNFGCFYVFDKNGKKQLKRQFTSHIYNCGISKSGKIAICQACKSEDSRSSNKLTAFRINPAKVIFSINPDHEWALDYSFADDDSGVEAILREGKTRLYLLTELSKAVS